jgi:hypothetical protein
MASDQQDNQGKQDAPKATPPEDSPGTARDPWLDAELTHEENEPPEHLPVLAATTPATPPADQVTAAGLPVAARSTDSTGEHITNVGAITMARLSVDQEVNTTEVADVRSVPPPKPEDTLRLMTLRGLFGLIAGSIIVIVFGLAFHWFGEDFSKTIIQTVVSPILGALAAVIGYLFAERKQAP